MASLRGLKASVMALIILAFLAVLVMVSRWLWINIMALDPGPIHPALAVVGGFIVGVGVAELLYTYIYFSPTTMLSNTIDDIVEIVGDILKGRAPWKPGSNVECREHNIVADGPYRCVRHPVYTAALTMFLGASLVKHYFLLASALMIAAYTILGVFEEARLNARTCGKYMEVMSDKPRLNPLSLLKCMLREIAGGTG
ncbi:hypothetical protein APE_0798 [Aeropyrum pernix K1]|uniref:Steroid 5-alpha reductase C-terminal domain-containing protein n=1 Tax=Aeropyrum pernix (strain ATCC 700893 / DSM 11879 / JCM 9820 / NBRC 100138 / K1) TaxID=272557 RepID=Q9YDX1_AERPE|nr:isoprenylcysteine carboxylmethyltransferase family protein [Aeropyrum pernix]BAA79776.1 hypothetical protein APE_0798 [Aeropyrum pernix K1]